jgi:hypothetical protein
MKRFVLGIFLLVVVVAGLGGAAFGAYTLWHEPQDETQAEAQAEAQQVRWGNVTVTIPSDSDIFYVREKSGIQIAGPVLELATSRHKSVVIIDAETGKVIRDDVLASERAAFDAVLATLKVGQLETTSGAGAPWPYGTTLPSTPTRVSGPISYVAPDSASGIVIDYIQYDAFGPDGSGSVLVFYNTRSELAIDAETGELLSDVPMHPDDREAFDRLLAQVRVADQLWPDGGQTEAQSDIRLEWERIRLEEAAKPTFEGVVNGIRLYTLDAGPDLQRKDACSDAKPDEVEHLTMSAVAGTPMEIIPTYLPPSAEEVDPMWPPVACKGILASVERQWIIRGNDVDIYIRRRQGEHAIATDASPERVSAGTVAGKPAVLVEPLTPEGYGYSAVIVAEDLGLTVVSAFGLPLEETVKIAEGLY